MNWAPEFAARIGFLPPAAGKEGARTCYRNGVYRNHSFSTRTKHPVLTPTANLVPLETHFLPPNCWSPGSGATRIPGSGSKLRARFRRGHTQHPYQDYHMLCSCLRQGHIFVPGLPRAGAVTAARSPENGRARERDCRAPAEVVVGARRRKRGIARQRTILFFQNDRKTTLVGWTSKCLGQEGDHEIQPCAPSGQCSSCVCAYPLACACAVRACDSVVCRCVCVCAACVCACACPAPHAHGVCLAVRAVCVCVRMSGPACARCLTARAARACACPRAHVRMCARDAAIDRARAAYVAVAARKGLCGADGLRECATQHVVILVRNWVPVAARAG